MIFVHTHQCPRDTDLKDLSEAASCDGQRISFPQRPFHVLAVVS